MSKNVAISVKNVSKTFKIPHEKVASLRGAFTGAVKGVFPPLPMGGGESSNRRGYPHSFSPAKGKAWKGFPSYEEFKALDDVSFGIGC